MLAAAQEFGQGKVLRAGSGLLVFPDNNKQGRCRLEAEEAWMAY